MPVCDSPLPPTQSRLLGFSQSFDIIRWLARKYVTCKTYVTVFMFSLLTTL